MIKSNHDYVREQTLDHLRRRIDREYMAQIRIRMSDPVWDQVLLLVAHPVKRELSKRSRPVYYPPRKQI